MSAERDLPKAKRIFDLALDTPPGQRAAFLSIACANDPHLRAHVDYMLREFGNDSSATGPTVSSNPSSPAGAGGSAPLFSAADKLAGRFEIQMLIGHGGMGEVYRALDLELNEIVALKALTASRDMRGDAAHRFRRELQLARQITHPNVCRLYDIGTHRADGHEILFLTMELLDGETLSHYLHTRGRFAAEEARPIIQQIASGLAAAHRERIVHRDLKPSNIMLTPARTVIMDFGLAHRESVSREFSLTSSGKVIGTLDYMAPEQLGGAGSISERTDLYAFGLVMYEMLTGARPFQAADVLASALKRLTDDPPAPHTIVTGIDPRWESAILTCLERDPTRRPETAEHVIDLLDHASRTRVGVAGRSAVTPAKESSPAKATSTASGRSRRWLWATLAAVAVAILVAVAAWLKAPSDAPRLVTRAGIALPGNSFISPVLSRDGTRLLYGEVALTPRLWVRMMDQLEGHPVAGTEGGEWGTFSPDGQSIVFLKEGQHRRLAKIPVSGGSAAILSDDNDFLTTPSFSEDGSILAGSARGLLRVPAAGGPSEALTAVNKKLGEIGHVEPAPLPGGRGILFTVVSGTSFDSARETSRLAVLDLRNGAYRLLPITGSVPSFTATGHLLYRRGAQLLAVPFDLAALKPTGPERVVLDGMSAGLAAGGLPFSLSQSGVLVYRPENSADGSHELTTLGWVDRRGAAQGSIDPQHQWQTVDLRYDISTAWISPNGKEVLSDLVESGGDAGKERVWAYDIGRGVRTPLTSGERDHHPIWAVDGRSVTFASHRGGNYGIYRVSAESGGQAPELLLSTGSAIPYPSSWARDGKTLAYYQFEQGKGRIMLLTPGGGGESKPYRFHPEAASSETQPVISPDGKWLAYTSSYSGRREVYVSPFPGAGANVQVSVQGGTFPRWSHSAHELFYVELNPRRLMAAEVFPGQTFRSGHPHPLFTVRNDDGPMCYDVAPDGKRFLVLTPLPKTAASVSQPTFVVVTNWFDELVRLAPLKK